MIIIGHHLVPFNSLYKVANIEDIKKTKPNSIVLIDFSNQSLVQYAKSQHISLALHVKNIKDACIANAIGAKFILVDKNISENIQNLANEYLFDSKILLCVDDENGIQSAAENFIDGVILKKGIV